MIWSKKELKEYIILHGGCEELAEKFSDVADCQLEFKVTRVWTDPKRQQDLIDRWLLGDREGLRCKPADPKKSRHCVVDKEQQPASRAIDIYHDEDALKKIGDWWIKLGYRWGGNFKNRDSIHYDLG